MSAADLHVITCISNPHLFYSRNSLFDKFLRTMIKAQVHLTVVELVYDDRITVTDKIIDKYRERTEEFRYEGIDVIPLRTRDVLWHKEQLINIGVDNLPDNWRYMAWIDADVEFQNPNWTTDTISKLNIYDVVQPWSHAFDLGPNHDIIDPSKPATSFMYAYKNKMVTRSGRYDDHNWHPGFAWAIRRDAYENLGGLIDTAVLGAGDRHMAMALVNKAKFSYPEKVSQGYKNVILGWQNRANSYLKNNVGFVPGLLLHGWHGKKRDRHYVDRWHTLVKYQFDPYTDLRLDRRQRLWQWSDMSTDRMRDMRDAFISYFSSRNEDSIDVE